MTGAARRASGAGSRIAQRPRSGGGGHDFLRRPPDLRGYSLRVIRRRKWWGPAVLEAVPDVWQNRNSVREFLSSRDHAAAADRVGDRKRVVSGKSGSVGVKIGGC